MTSTLGYPPVMSSLNKMSSHEGYSSADSESRKHNQPESATKKRPSRAGTRSVTTLTAAQLERKRANDREAQRAIRQRTKDHIESLERRIAELTSQGDNGRVLEYAQRNEQLEEENALLRRQLDQAMHSLGNLDSPGIQGAEGPLMTTPSAPHPATDRLQSIHHPRPASASTARSIPSISSAAVSQGEWVQHAAYSPATTSSPMDAPPQPGHHHGGANTSDLRWASHTQSHNPGTQPLAPVPQQSYHNVEQPQLGYYAADHAARNVQYGSEPSQAQQSLPFGNAPPHQQSVPQQQAAGNSYAYPQASSIPPPGATDFGQQQRPMSAQHQQYQAYPHHQSYISPSPTQPSPSTVQQAGEGLQMMHQQGAAAAQPGSHIMYDMKSGTS